MDSCVIDMTGLNGILDPDVGVEVKQTCRIENIYLIGKGIIPGIHVVLFRASSSPSIIKNIRSENGIAGIYSVFSQLKIENAIIRRCGASEINLGALDYNTLFEIYNSLIIAVPGSINGGGGRGIHSEGGYQIIKNNIIIQKTSINTICGVSCEFTRSTILTNNLISGFDPANYGGWEPIDSLYVVNNTFLYDTLDFSGSSGSVTIRTGLKTRFRNNMIVNNMIGLRCINDTLYSNYNLFWNNNQDIRGKIKIGVNDKFSDPMFVMDGNPYWQLYDFHLQKYLPGIDAGNPNILDKDGSRSDIGMFGGPDGESYTYWT
jgi:hypothetical protein